MDERATGARTLSVPPVRTPRLIFVAFNQDPSRQFAVVQNRLNDEPMIDNIAPVGGGYFFAPPGARNASDWVGSGLFAE